jgi:hypothetical protein
MHERFIEPPIPPCNNKQQPQKNIFNINNKRHERLIKVRKIDNVHISSKSVMEKELSEKSNRDNN